MRSFLTMLGIVIGISSVILVMAIGAGAENLITSQVTQMGTNLVGVLPGKTEDQGPPAAALGVTVTTLKREDAQAIKELPDIKAASPYVGGRSNVNYRNRAEFYDFTGVNASYVNLEDTSVAQGRFLTQRDIDSYARVAVLGYKVKEELFAGRDPVGKYIRLKKQRFKVIGVMKERGSSIFGNFDSNIFVPVSTAQKRLLGIDHVNFIRAKMLEGANKKQIKTSVEQLLRHRHNISDPSKDDFMVRTMAQMLSILKNVTGAIRAFLVMVVAISLIVGGIGIMNIMLVSLSERVREVGLRKALGARDSNIRTQFLIESSLLAFLAGIIGILLGLGLGVGISYLIRTFTALNWKFIISPGQIGLAALVSILIGLSFGYYPARKAAKLDPIDALKYE